MTDILIMLGIIIASLFIIQKLPSRKSLLYVLLSIGIIPIFYFYSIKYYYVDHATNTAGAYILVAAMCTVVLFNELKQLFPKFVIVCNILQVISIVAATSYLLLYKSKVSILALIFFLILSISRILKNTILRDKRLYCVFSLFLLLGSIAIRIITQGNHDGLTCIYTNGGPVLFLISLGLLGYWLLSLYEFAKKTETLK